MSIENLLYNINEKFKIKGIICVGANIGQEIPTYLKYTNNIILFEPIPEHYNTLKTNYSNLIVYNFALGDTNEKSFLNYSSNNGESSSILKPLHHIKYYPHIKFEKLLDIEIKRFDSLNIDYEKYNVIVSDTQGYELKVLIGFGESIKNFDGIIIEYINTSLYENDSTIYQLKNYLKPFQYKLQTTDDEIFGVGNALFLKEKL